MNSWRSQPYRIDGIAQNVDSAVLENAIAASRAVVRVDHRMPPVLTLRHLAYLTDVNFQTLRDIVGRVRKDPYRAFHVRKRKRPDEKQRYRIICVPEPPLLQAQSWIAHRILSFGKPHAASTAYGSGCSIESAVSRHCGASTLIKLDVQRFFESISELQVYRVFRRLGYQPLVAFEMTRICTRQVYRGRPELDRERLSHRAPYLIKAYKQGAIGYLPQGAPTSPMLANLAAYELDDTIEEIARRRDLRYSRYADDITLSMHGDAMSKRQAHEVIDKVYEAMWMHGLSPNRAKAKIVGPGARKVVLGLLVDGERPRLTREFKANLRMHLYYLLHPAIGPTQHAERRRFAAVAGLRHHLQGLIAYANQIEPEYAMLRKAEFDGIEWPL